MPPGYTRTDFKIFRLKMPGDLSCWRDMYERADRIGARLAIDSRAGQGTRLMLTLMLCLRWRQCQLRLLRWGHRAN